jgi:hypothetical protein
MGVVKKVEMYVVQGHEWYVVHEGKKYVVHTGKVGAKSSYQEAPGTAAATASAGQTFRRAVALFGGDKRRQLIYFSVSLPHRRLPFFTRPFVRPRRACRTIPFFYLS